MNNTLIVKKTTTLCNKLYHSNDMLIYYGIPGFIDEISKINRKNILNNLSCSAIIFDALNQTSNTEEFVIEIPTQLRQLINEGKAQFDDSNKKPGYYTPNIRIKGQKGIKGQIYLTKQNNLEKFTGALSSLAMMAMVQDAMLKLNQVCESTKDILKGQLNDRISNVIGPYKAFIDMYKYFKTDEEMRYSANNVYINMQQGLSAIHLDLNEKMRKLADVPQNNFQVFYKEIFRTFDNKIEYYRQIYSDFIYEIKLYMRLIILSDIILGCKGLDAKAIYNNHKPFSYYCKDNLTPKFLKNMKFLTNTDDPGLQEILNFNASITEGTILLEQSSIDIECSKKEINHFNN